jgi:hypothetical protein
MRKLATAIVTAGVAAGFIGLAPAASAQTTDNTEFCDTVLEVEAAISQEAFDELDPLLTQLESSAPPEIAPTVQTLVSLTRTALESESDPTGDPAYLQAESTVGEYIYNSCGWQQAEVTMLEYEFTGLPKSFTTGPAVFKIVNEGAEVHEFLPLRIKTKDSLRKIIGLSEKKAEKKIQVLGHDIAPPGGTTYGIVDFKRPGRYGAVCFLPVGTTDLAQLEEEHSEGGPPHALEGMYASFKVTKA